MSSISPRYQITGGSKIGVLVPTHKRAHLIGRALDSIKEQTKRPNLVIVVANGMSQEEFEPYHDVLYDGLHKGTSASGYHLFYPHFANIAQALQFGLAYMPSDTDYVAVLEDDDEWLPEFLEKMSDALDRRGDVSMVYCDEIEYSKDGDEVDWTGHPEEFSRAALLRGNWLHFPVQMWRYETLVGTGGFSAETSGAADWDIALRMSAHGVYHLREKLSVHHWLTDRDDDSPQNNCLDPDKMRGPNMWIEARKQLGVYE